MNDPWGDPVSPAHTNDDWGDPVSPDMRAEDMQAATDERQRERLRRDFSELPAELQREVIFTEVPGLRRFQSTVDGMEDGEEKQRGQKLVNKNVLNNMKQMGLESEAFQRGLTPHEQRMAEVRKEEGFRGRTVMTRATARAGLDFGALPTNLALRGMGLLGVKGADEAADNNVRIREMWADIDRAEDKEGMLAKYTHPAVAETVGFLTEMGVTGFLAGSSVAEGLGMTGDLAATKSLAAFYGLSSADRALKDASDAGLTGATRYGYAAGVGGLEAGIMLTMGKIGTRYGIRSTEEMFSANMKSAGTRLLSKHGVYQALGETVAGMGAEAAEEGLTQFSQQVWGSVMGAESLDGIGRNVAKAAALGAVASGAFHGTHAIQKAFNEAVTAAPKYVDATLRAEQFVKDAPTGAVQRARDATTLEEFQEATGIHVTRADDPGKFKEAFQGRISFLEDAQEQRISRVLQSAQRKGMPLLTDQQLTDDQHSALHFYTHGSGRLNTWLRTRKGGDGPFLSGKASKIRQAMKMLPVFEGEVYRGTSLDRVKHLKVGDTFVDKGFLSTSTRKPIAEGFAGAAEGEGALLAIRSKTGRSISFLAEDKLEGEKEVLFPDSTSFKVAEEKTDSNGRKVFVLEESDGGSRPLLKQPRFRLDEAQDFMEAFQDHLHADHAPATPPIKPTTTKESQSIVATVGPPQELTPGDSSAVTIRNVDTEAYAKQMGINTFYSPAQQSQVEWIQQAKQQGIPDKVKYIASQVTANPRSLTPVEAQGFAMKMSELIQTFKEYDKRILGESDPAVITKLIEDQGRVADDFAILETATHVADTEWGRQGVAIQLAIGNDMSPLGLAARAKSAKRKNLTATEAKEFLDHGRELTDIQGQIDSLTTEVQDALTVKLLQDGNKRLATEDIQALTRRAQELMTDCDV